MKLWPLIFLLCVSATTELPPLPSDVVEKPVLQSPKAKADIQNARMVRASVVVIPPPRELILIPPTNGTTFYIQQTIDMTNWVNLAGPFSHAQSGITNWLTVTNRGEAQRFFRIMGL